jgi:hypothetical protein
LAIRKEIQFPFMIGSHFHNSYLFLLWRIITSRARRYDYWDYQPLLLSYVFWRTTWINSLSWFSITSSKRNNRQI